LEVSVKNPDLHQEEYLIIRLKIGQDLDNFFIMQCPGGSDTMITKTDSLNRTFTTMTFADLFFDYLVSLDPNLRESSYVDEDRVYECQSLDIFDILSTMHVGGNYENANQENRRRIYGSSIVGIDVIAFSRNNEVILCQRCTEWKEVKVTDILKTCCIPSQVKIIDIADLMMLFSDVKKCMSPYELARKMFT
jgi:hypothetical protein